MVITYTRSQLFALCSSDVTPARATRKAIFSQRLWQPARERKQFRWKTQRASADQTNAPLSLSTGRQPPRRSLPCLRSVGNGAAIIVGNRRRRPYPPAVRRPLRTSCLRRVHVDRHAVSRGPALVFGCLNIRSVTNKLDDLLDVRRDLNIDVLFLVETWHDADSVSFRRLRADGFQVVDRLRPRLRADTLSTNHGGVAAVAVNGIRLTRLDVGISCTSCELLCVRVAAGASSCVAVVVYRTGPVTSAFFNDLSDVLDRIVTYADPIYVVGDVNIRLDRPDDPVSRQFTDTLATHGLTCRVTTPTHDRGGLLDIVATRDDLPAPSVEVVDIGLSDHRLLQWTVSLVRPCPEYTTRKCRPWRLLDTDVFSAALQSSLLCRPDVWRDLDVDGLAELYNTETVAILDRLIPARTVTRRRRPSDAWFDEECRAMKRRVRRLESAVRRAVPTDAVAVAAANAAWTTERRIYRALLRSKREAFWVNKVDSECSSPRQLWRSVDTLMGRGRVPASDVVDATAFHRHFDTKVADVRELTADAPPPSFTPSPPGCLLAEFRPLTAADVAAAVRALPDKQSTTDPIPTSLLKSSVDVLLPFLVELYNRSLLTGSVPTVFKAAYITPLQKKPELDPDDVRSYRPISNLPVLSKLLERLVARQLLDYLNAASLMPDLQSAYRAYHSTETAVLKVLADILRALDSGDFAALTLLDLSAAFDTVDHVTLLRRLEKSYGLAGCVLSWFTSYLNDRTQFVRCRKSASHPTVVLCGVPQGSVLGPILFLLYTADLLRLVELNNLRPHLYADDTQIYGFCHPTGTAQLQQQMSACIDDVAMWMRSNRLQLNTAKTEVLWCSSSRRQDQLPRTALRVGNDSVLPSSSVRDLGIYLDSDASMTTHVSKTVSCCFAVLRQIRSIRRSVTQQVVQSLVASLVLTRLDYGNATLAGLPTTQLDRLQSVMNAAARLVCSARKFEHITPLLRDLHWLRVPQRIEFKLAVLAFRCLHGTAPPYLSCELRRVADIAARRRLRSSSTSDLDVPPSRLVTIGDRAFGVAASRVWNALPPNVTAAPSLPVFKRRLKTMLFSRSFT